MNNDRIEHFKKKYGEAIIANGLRLRPDDFMDEVEWRDAVDQHYTKIWLEFTYGGLYARRVLDERTRVLVAIAQFLTLNEMEEFEPNKFRIKTFGNKIPLVYSIKATKK